MARSEIAIYGEVNGVLRRHIRGLKRQFPYATILHLTRDGRDVVRSMHSRQTMTKRDPVSSKIVPKYNDRMFERWSAASRFEKICWYWARENAYLRRHANHMIQLEQILTDYSYFKENILDKLNLNIPHYIWLSKVNKKINSTDKYKMAHWSRWTEVQKSIFNEICGKEQYANGYEFRN